MINSVRTVLVLFIFGLAMSVSTATAGLVETFDDIEIWIGTGVNEAAFVLDWNDPGNSQDPLVWGYRWDGAATGQDMFEAIVAADDRLFAKISAPGPFGVTTFGIGYDADEDGFGISDGTTFDADGFFVTTTSNADGATATDANDSYQEGWFTGFWSYYVGTGDPYDGGSWGFASTGISGRNLSDGDWDGLSFAPAFSFTEPSQGFAATTGGMAAVPEPSTLALCGLAGVGALIVRHRRLRQRKNQS